MLGVVGIFLAAGALYFDGWWHVVIGRDSFWIPPHLVLYSGVFLTGLGFAAEAWRRWRSGSAWDLSLKVWGAGVFMIFLLAPFDDLWHRIFGTEPIDSLLIFWSPPHLLGIGSAILVAVGLVLALAPRWQARPRGSLFVLILLAFTAINGFSAFLVMPFSPIDHRLGGPFGAFIFYLVFIAWRIAALAILRRPVLTYLAVLQWFFSALLLSHLVVEGVTDPFRLLIVMVVGILAALAGDVAFVTLRGIGTSLVYPWVGLAYTTVGGLALYPLFNRFWGLGYHTSDLIMIALAEMTGGFVAGLVGPQIARLLGSRTAGVRVPDARAVRAGTLGMNVLIAVLAVGFAGAIAKTTNPALVESSGPRLEGQGERIGRIPEGWSLVRRWFDPAIRISPDGRRVAYTVSREGKWRVVVDGVEPKASNMVEPKASAPIEGKPYDRVSSIQFSPDGAKIAYLASRDGLEFLVVDGVEGRTYPDRGDSPFPITFSPDGRRAAYIVPGFPRWRIVVDGIEPREYHAISEPVFSPDGRHVAFAAALGKRWRVVVDGVEGETYDVIAGLKFESSDRLSYIAVMGSSMLRVEHRLDAPGAG